MSTVSTSARLLQTVGAARGGGGLVDDPEDLQTGRLARGNGGLALGVAEVGGNGDHGAVDHLPELRLGVLLQALEHERREVGGVVVALVKAQPIERAAHVRLEEAGDLVVPQPRPFLGLLSDRRRIGAEVDDGGRDVRPLTIGNDLGPAVGVAARDDGVGRSQVDADEGTHRQELRGLCATSSSVYSGEQYTLASIGSSTTPSNRN